MPSPGCFPGPSGYFGPSLSPTGALDRERQGCLPGGRGGVYAVIWDEAAADPPRGMCCQPRSPRVQSRSR